ncbi:C-5 cytosine-specific DNA methylase [Sulfobacillus acidophilus DSM 10332]|uniref:DNA (cytosine-5-)-methyltransferase n=1 Tax=Sulfobacillus acidophilus (strain ATCC 700253 / DSM 10332 / NAL) TaxID=679936 RepID=G8TZ93_SULAD|nr:C-5 cytosine-specific DNA methylase [Sulfobacillus acidophilus DSM 10332]
MPVTSEVRDFLHVDPPVIPGNRTAVSLFSGAGLSDMGYELAGFHFQINVELNVQRCQVGQPNFPGSTWINGDVRDVTDIIVQVYQKKTRRPLDLLTVTPPCQGMSSSNPSRGRRHSPQAELHEERNKLLLAAVPVAQSLNPKIIVAENVRQILTLQIWEGDQRKLLVDVFKKRLPNYAVFTGVIQAADYGIPQNRRRGLIVAIRRDQPWLDALIDRGLLPWPVPTHAENPESNRKSWISLKDWFDSMNYEPLDGSSPRTSRGTDPLHYVPHYDDDRYLWIRDIPPYSGRNAYQNSRCPSCGHDPVPEGLAYCNACGGIMRNRPYVLDKETAKVRLVKGFASSYRRMNAYGPAPTITTNSSSIGSDFKIHPWENRVLSIRECADLQTVPRFFDWSWALTTGHPYTIRQVVGEALPTYFTYLHGKVLARLLIGEPPHESWLARADNRRLREMPTEHIDILGDHCEAIEPCM